MKLQTIILSISLAISSQASSQVLSTELIDSTIQSGARFGFAMDMDGEWLAVSSSFWDDQAHVPSPLIDIGSVSIFQQTDGEWVFQKRIVADEQHQQVRSQFGKGLSLSDGVLVIGQANAGTSSHPRSGRVHIYQVNAGGQANWGLVQVLQPPAAQAGARFGFAVDNIDNLIVVGEYKYNTDGRVHVYQLNDDGEIWDPVGVLNPIQSCQVNPGKFGWSVAIDQVPNSDQYAMIVGDPGASFLSSCSGGVLSLEVGSVHFFETHAGIWEAKNLIRNISAGSGDFFLDFGRLGHSVDLDMTTGHAISGAPGQRIPFDFGQGFVGFAHGQALIFDLNTSSREWAIADQFVPYIRNDPEDEFGVGVAVSGDIAVVTASTGEQVLMYGRHAGGGYNQWGEVENIDLTPSTSGEGIAHVSYQQSRLLISSPNNDSTGSDSASGSVFVLNNQSTCLADLNHDGQVDFHDPTIYLAAYHQSDSTADWDQNGTLNFFDISAFLTDLSAGCK